MNLFTQASHPTLTVLVTGEPIKVERATAKLKHSYRVDCSFKDDDGATRVITAWHNHESKPKLKPGDSVVITATPRDDAPAFISLPRDCHV